MPGQDSRKAAGFLLQIERTQVGAEAGALEAAPLRDEPVTGFDLLPDEDKRAVEGALAKIADPSGMEVEEQGALEAIIIPDRRPVVSILNDDYSVVEKDWAHLNEAPFRAAILPCIPAIGRLDVPDHPRIPYAGTAFVVAPDLLMTNRHVAELFVSGLGRQGLVFHPGLTGAVNFAQEEGRPGEAAFVVDEAVLIHPYWDMALLRVRDLDPAIRPLVLGRDDDPSASTPPDVVVIGYPAFDLRNDVDVQRRVFGSRFNVKRLQPGKLLPRRQVASFGKTVEALTHDSSTLGGNSGSAIIDARTGRVRALHFGGRYLEANYGVPAADLAHDARLLDLGLGFDQSGGPPTASEGEWDAWWRRVETEAAAPSAPASDAGAAAAAANTGPGTASWTFPLVVTVRAGAPIAATVAGAAAAAGEALVEKMVEPWHEESYQREGYRPDFLGPEVPLPEPTDPDMLARLEDGGHVVPYMHFSLAMHRTRRLALYTAANVRADDRAKRPDPARKYTRDALAGLGEDDVEKWFSDPRLRGLDQLPDKFFTRDRKSFDKGHLVRREDVAWGDTFEELRIANGDTYHVTNCSPQTKGFNRADGVVNWGELEKAVLGQAEDQRLSVFAGPILADDDPWFEGVDDIGRIRVRIPQAYWKVVVAREGRGLAAYGFLLAHDLSGVDMEERLAFDPKWTASIRPLAELEARIGRLTFPAAVHRADRHGGDSAERVLRGAAPATGARP